MRRELERPARRRARASSEAAELRAVLDTLRDGVQVFDAAGNMVSLNPAAAQMYELDEETPTLEGIFSKWEIINEQGVPLTHDERPLVRAMRGEPSDLVVVGIRRVVDGSVRWLSVSTSIIREPGGAVSGYVSCTRDVTQRIETIRGLRILTQAAARLSGSLVPETVTRVLAECASDLCSTPGERPRRAVVMLVEDDHMVLTGLTDQTHEGDYPSPVVPLADNPYARRVLESGETLVTAFDPADFGPSSAETIRAAGVRNAAMVPMRRDGRIFAILAVSGRQEALLSADIVSHLTTLASMGELAYVNADKHDVAERNSRADPLTGVANRRALEERWSTLPRVPFAIIAVDVDHLKQVNDTHGHHAGDELIQGVASAMAAQLRASDMVARTGGDEFAVLLVNCSKREVERAASRLRRAIETVVFPWGHASASFGCATGAPGDDPVAVLEEADRSLYEAKAQR